MQSAGLYYSAFRPVPLENDTQWAWAADRCALKLELPLLKLLISTAGLPRAPEVCFVPSNPQSSLVSNNKRPPTVAPSYPPPKSA